ncbi:hypothetical protein ABZX69_37570, partial [Streptomyces sp. NPDC004074]|uniref:hypothetical protein n=1 Tax=Streptomyces sp. NPDC004074 TaxID=3154277 RepID=UPI0033AFAF38
HIRLNNVPGHAFVLGVLGDRRLYVPPKVTPGTPRGLVRTGLLLAPRLRGRGPVLVSELFDLDLRLGGRALLLHQ